MLQHSRPGCRCKRHRLSRQENKDWRDKLGLHKAGLYLAQLVRMQEEIGTGGGGFRYILCRLFAGSFSIFAN